LRILVALFLLLISNSAFSYTGYIAAINANTEHKGFWIQLTNGTDTTKSIVFEAGSSCQAHWAFVGASDVPLANMYLSMAMTARTTDEMVVISTQGCTASATGNMYPKLIWMDFGKRISQ